MSTTLIFNRKVIPLAVGEKGAAKVETDIVGFIDSAPYEIGHVNFPNKQSWTKFWGAIQRGALNIPEFDVKLQNVMIEEGEEGMPQAIVGGVTPQKAPEPGEVGEVDSDSDVGARPAKRWVGNQLVDEPTK